MIICTWRHEKTPVSGFGLTHPETNCHIHIPHHTRRRPSLIRFILIYRSNGILPTIFILYKKRSVFLCISCLVVGGLVREETRN